jgi:histidyl-tRNA synthetase
MKANPQVLKGMRDFLPQRMILRHYVTDQLRNVFERFGFEPLQTPSVEYAETLEGKYGEEADKLIYKFEDRGGRHVGLRYDLTVPLSRIVAMYPELPKPFKRYQIAPVWRAERPQRGRYREFYQCDVDIVGCSSIVADAEVVTIAYQSLRQLGFTAFRILINNRKILQAMSEIAGITAEQTPGVWRAVDKWDKIGRDGVRNDLVAVGLSDETIARLFKLLDVSGSATDILHTLGASVADVPVGTQGVHELEELVSFLELAGVPPEFYQVDPHMVRGLDYYTGPIFEIVVDEPKIGSLSGGGRYDHLIGLLGAPEAPAVGISLGLERLIDVIDELGMAPAHVRSTVTTVLVTVFDAKLQGESLAVAASLRAAGINSEVFLGVEKLSSQLRYASRKNIPLAIILGPEELQRGEVVLKNLVTGNQIVVERGALPGAIESNMAEIARLQSPILTSPNG